MAALESEDGLLRRGQIPDAGFSVANFTGNVTIPASSCGRLHCLTHFPPLIPMIRPLFVLFLPLAFVSCMMVDNAGLPRSTPAEQAAAGLTSVIGAPYEVLYGALSGVEQIAKGEENPTFYFDKNKRLPAYLDADELALAEKMLKEGADPKYKIGGKSAVYHYAYHREKNKADLLVKYGANHRDIGRAEDQRKKDDIKAMAEAKERAQRQQEALASLGRFFRSAPRDAGAGGGGPARLSPYRDCTILSDKLAGVALAKGTNGMVIRDDATGTQWGIIYNFGSGSNGYLVSGPGDLRGRKANIRFDNGVPASIMTAEGHCRITSARKR